MSFRLCLRRFIMKMAKSMVAHFTWKWPNLFSTIHMKIAQYLVKPWGAPAGGPGWARPGTPNIWWNSVETVTSSSLHREPQIIFCQHPSWVKHDVALSQLKPQHHTPSSSCKIKNQLKFLLFSNETQKIALLFRKSTSYCMHGEKIQLLSVLMPSISRDTFRQILLWKI